MKSIAEQVHELETERDAALLAVETAAEDLQEVVATAVELYDFAVALEAELTKTRSQRDALVKFSEEVLETLNLAIKASSARTPAPARATVAFRPITISVLPPHTFG